MFDLSPHVSPQWVLLAFVIYLLSHAARAFKFWIIYGDGRLPFRQTFAIFQITAVMGYWAPLIFSEMIRVGLVSYMRRDLMRAIVAEVLSRALDFVWLGFLLSASEQTRRLGWIGLTVGGFIILAFYSLQQLIKPVKVALMTRAHTSTVVRLLRWTDRLGRMGREIAQYPPLLMLGLFLTAGIWMLDGLALSLILPVDHPFGGTPLESLQRWALQSLESVFGRSQVLSADQLNRLYDLLFVPQLYAALVIGALLIWKIRPRQSALEVGEGLT